MAQSITGTHLAASWAAPSARPAVRVLVDWDTDGDYTGPDEDITSRVLDITIAHGLYDALGGLPVLGTVTASTASATVDNSDRWLSPDNPSGIVADHPELAGGYYRVPIRIEMGYVHGGAPELLVQFVGEIESSEQQESYGQAVVQFACLDRSLGLTQAKQSSAIYRAYRADALMAVLLVGAGYLSYDLDTAITEVPHAWLDDENVLEEIKALAAADGGMFWFSKGGTPTYRRMTAPLERADSRMAVVDLEAGSAETVRDSLAWRDMYSGIIVEWAGRYVGALADLWTAPRAVSVPPGATVREEARFRYPAERVLAPVYDTDYTCITSAPKVVPSNLVTIAMTAYGQRAILDITNHDTANTIHLLGLRVRGFPLLGEEAQERRYDQTLGLVPGEKVYAVRGNPYRQSEAQAERIGPYLRDRLQAPRRLYTWRGPCCPWLELLDRVHLDTTGESPSSGLDTDGYVVQMRLGYRAGGMLTQELLLLPCAGVYAFDSYFLLGSSAYDGILPVGY